MIHFYRGCCSWRAIWSELAVLWQFVMIWFAVQPVLPDYNSATRWTHVFGWKPSGHNHNQDPKNPKNPKTQIPQFLQTPYDLSIPLPFFFCCCCNTMPDTFHKKISNCSNIQFLNPKFLQPKNSKTQIPQIPNPISPITLWFVVPHHKSRFI